MNETKEVATRSTATDFCETLSADSRLLQNNSINGKKANPTGNPGGCAEPYRVPEKLRVPERQRVQQLTGAAL
jgi:hypothetical protein